MTPPLVLAITGASGAIYATRLLEVLRSLQITVHLTISPPAVLVLRQELELDVRLDDFSLDQLLPRGELTFDRCAATSEMSGNELPPVATPGKVTYHHYQNFMAAIASGSFASRGMVVCPCSGSTLSAVVTGSSENLIHRAIEVHLKERRKLILVPRETPLSQVAIDNMQRASQLGAVLLPAMPGWYHGLRTARDLVDFVVSRILDQLQIENDLMQRRGSGDA